MSKRFDTIHGLDLAAVERGSGGPIVFLHGNPTSSYVWRNVIPHVEELGRCIAPDLIGFGDSAKLPDSGPGSYRFIETRSYLDAHLEALGVTDNVILVLHDWGSGLGFDWAYRHADRISGIAYFEAIVAPRSWSQLSEDGLHFFERLRTEAGEEIALVDNVFIEMGLPGGVIRTLTDDEHAEYRRPFLQAGEDRRPTLTWPREIPFDGEPADVHDIVRAYSQWLAEATFPKLLIDISDGDTLSGDLLAFARTFPNQTEAKAIGRHFAQEDSPDEIGAAIADWIRTVVRPA